MFKNPEILHACQNDTETMGIARFLTMASAPAVMVPSAGIPEEQEDGSGGGESGYSVINPSAGYGGSGGNGGTAGKRLWSSATTRRARRRP